jgi:2-polyprenyl-3-methyl-5-hydroxy-6-metoxy-1,4-benzoquinol methylase
VSSCTESFRPCPICASATTTPLLVKNELHLVKCANCSFIFASPVPAEIASGSYYDALGRPFYLSPDKLNSDYASVRFERELRFFRKFCQAGSVLDVGCSTGAFLYQLKTRWPGNYQVTGTDISKPAAEYARGKGLEILDRSFLEFDFAERRFDAVTFWAVMEHLENPKGFLSVAASILKPGGHCFILVPNMGALAVRLAGAKYRYIFPQHLNYFTSDTLKRFAAIDSRFDVVYNTSTHFNPIVIWQDMRGQGKLVADEDRAALLKKTTSYKQNPLLAPVKLAYKCVERLLASVNLADNLVIVLRKK